MALRGPLFEKRSAASEAVLGGRVHVNGAWVKPAKELALGDTLELTLPSGKRTVQVAGLSDMRGPAAAAATLYAETPDSIAARERQALQRGLAKPLGADLGERPSSATGGGSRRCGMARTAGPDAEASTQRALRRGLSLS